MIFSVLCLVSFVIGAWLAYPAGKTQGRVEEYERWLNVFERVGINEWEIFENCEKVLSEGSQDRVFKVIKRRGNHAVKAEGGVGDKDNSRKALKCAFCLRFDDCMASMDSASPLPIKCITKNYQFFELDKRSLYGEH